MSMWTPILLVFSFSLLLAAYLSISLAIILHLPVNNEREKRKNTLKSADRDRERLQGNWKFSECRTPDLTDQRPIRKQKITNENEMSFALRIGARES